MPDMLKLLFSPRGRIGRRSYMIGLIGMVVITTLFNFTLGKLSGSLFGFLIALPFPFVVLHMTYCVYGKRLHDIGRSFWPITGLITALIFTMIFIMLEFGGLEYFEAFQKHSNENTLTEEIGKAIQERYQEKLVPGLPWLYGTMSGLIGIFSLWLFFSTPDPKDNRYGSPEQ